MLSIRAWYGRTTTWFGHGVIGDVRTAARSFRTQPRFATIVVLTFALGIGGTVGIFSIVDPLFLRPLAIERPGELVAFFDGDRDTFRYPDFEQLRDEAGAFSSLAGATRTGLSRQIQFQGADLRVAVQEASDNYFDVLGIRASMGRIFRSGVVETDSPVAVISQAFFAAHFGDGAEALGSSFRYLNTDFTIVGVAPPDFSGLYIDRPTDIWVPIEQALPADSMMRTTGRFFQIVGRLSEGVGVDAASENASAVLDRPIVVEQDPTGYSGVRGTLRLPFIILQIGVLALLLIAAANLANLTLVRGVTRQQEFQTRWSLGATKFRIVRQLMVECAVLGVAGAVLAVPLAYWANTAILAFLPPESMSIIERIDFDMDPRIVAGLAVALISSVAVVGFVPALLVTRESAGPQPGGHRSTESRSHRRLSMSFAIAQTALSVFVVIGAALFLRSLAGFWAIDAGFEADGVLMADVVAQQNGGVYEPLVPILEQLQSGLQQSPLVEEVAFSSMGQMTGYGIENPIFSATSDGSSQAYELSVSPGYFSVMGISSIRGRDFNDADRPGAPDVAIVNETFARSIFGSDSILGSRFGLTAQEGSSLEVVGVVEDSKWFDLRENSLPMYYRPFQQRAAPSGVIVARAPGGQRPAMNALRELVAPLQGRAELSEVVPFTTVVNRTLLAERVIAHVLSALGAVTLLIVAIGLYSLIAFDVARRGREIAVRVALGATRKAVAWIIGRRALAVLGSGVLLGSLLFLFASRRVSTLVFGVSPWDPSSIAVGVFLLSCVILVASSCAVLKALRLSPSRALQSE